MIEKEFISAIRASVGAGESASTEEVLQMALFHINDSRRKALPVSKDNQERGIGDLLQNFGSSEAMLAAFLLQIFMKYSKDIVDEVIKYLRELDEGEQNGSKDVSC